MKKLLALVLALTMILTMVISAASAEEKVTITFWDGNWNEETFKTVQEMWNEQYPDIELVGEFQIDSGMSDKYMLALSNGTAPDVVACALDWVTTYGNAGLLSPLDEYIAADGVDTSAYVEGAINASTIDGKLYGLPFRSETYTLFYNKDLLAAAGYTEPPKTWDEALEIAAACTKDDVSGWGLCGANYGNTSFQYITTLRSMGSDILNDDMTQGNVTSELGLKAANIYKQLQQYAPASLLENANTENRTLFASGKVAMYMSGIYDVETIQSSNPDLNFGCAMVPTMTGDDAERSTILGGWSVAIPECSKNKDAAWKFVKFLTSTDVAKVYTNTFTGTQEPAARFETMSADIVDANQTALTYARALPAVAKIVNIREAIFDNIVMMLTDDLSPEEAMEELNSTINDLLQ